MPDIYDTISQIVTDLIKTHDLKEICDYGCGEGLLMYKLSEFNPSCRLTGIDFFKKYEMSLKTSDQIIQLDREEINTEAMKEKFDLIISTFALHHFQYPVSELRKLFTLLKPGGYLFFLDHQLIFGTKAKVVKAITSFIGEIKKTLKSGYHRHHYTVAEALDLIGVLPVEIMTVQEFSREMSEEEIQKDQNELIERNTKIQEMIKEKANDFFRQIWVPLYEMEGRLIQEHGIDYNDVFYIVCHKKEFTDSDRK